MEPIGRFICGKIIYQRIISYSYIQRRNSLYTPNYVEPVVNKKKLEELEKVGELEQLAYVPVKAARSEQTTSVFNSEIVNTFVNLVLRKGNKTLARELVEQALANVKRTQLAKYHSSPEDVRKEIECNPMKIFVQAVENSKPLLELTAIKRGGITYQVPVPLTEARSQFLAMKWLIEASKEKDRNLRFHVQLATELINAASNQGRVVKKKQDLHKQCEANKAYAHYRWS